MNITSKIDWLTLTKKFEKGVESPQNIYFAKEFAVGIIDDIWGETDWSLDFKRQEGFYPWVFEIKPFGATVAIPANVQVQGVRLVLPGKACSDEWALGLAIMYAKDNGWSATRLDFAVDIVGREIDWADTHKTLAEFGHEKGRTVGYFEGRTGNTVYVGSRQSGNYLRVYDKGKEQSVDYSWVRLELETKGDVSRMLMGLNVPLHEAALRHMAAWLSDWNSPLMDDVMGLCSSPPLLMKPGRKYRTDRELWLEKSVLPALRQLAIDDYEAALAWVYKAQALVDAVDLMR